MDDPTPTRAEAERFGCDQLGMDKMPDGEWVRFTDYADLRERAEAAERHKDAGWDQQRYWCDRYVNKTAALEKALVEARRAEAAAWNDAIEAAEAAYAHGFAAIRALRRAAPTEGEA